MEGSDDIRAIVFHEFEFVQWFSYPLWLGMKLMGWNTERCHASLVVWKQGKATCYSWGDEGLFILPMSEVKRTFHSGFVIPAPYAPLRCHEMSKRRVTPLSCVRAFLGQRDANTCVSMVMSAAGYKPVQFPDHVLTYLVKPDIVVLDGEGTWHII